jgi:hypothetical protein
MHGERVPEIGVVGEVSTRIDVVVTGGDDEGVLPIGAPDQLGDGSRMPADRRYRGHTHPTVMFRT